MPEILENLLSLLTLPGPYCQAPPTMCSPLSQTPPTSFLLHCFGSWSAPHRITPSRPTSTLLSPPPNANLYCPHPVQMMPPPAGMDGCLCHTWSFVIIKLWKSCYYFQCCSNCNLPPCQPLAFQPDTQVRLLLNVWPASHLQQCTSVRPPPQWQRLLPTLQSPCSFVAVGNLPASCLVFGKGVSQTSTVSQTAMSAPSFRFGQAISHPSTSAPSFRFGR